MIYQRITEAQIPLSDLQEVGWTKLREICTKVAPDQLGDWVKKAKNLTVHELVAELVSGVQGSVNEQAKLSFNLYVDQVSAVKEALEMCKKDSGTKHDNVALEHICMDYLAGHSAETVSKHYDLDYNIGCILHKCGGDEEKSLDEILDAVRKRFTGWKITATKAVNSSA